MNPIIIPMLIGHFVADFWLQPSSWVRDKNKYGLKSKKLLFHSLIAAILPTIFTFDITYWWFIPIIFVTHYLTDWLKISRKRKLFWFIVDQLIHIGVIVALSQVISKNILSQQTIHYSIIALSVILATTPSGIFIGMFLEQILNKESKERKLDASAWIGIIERVLIIVFILVNQFQAIGFLIAAKSIFRFNDMKNDINKKAEYFLLGTLASFAAAIAIGVGVKIIL